MKADELWKLFAETGDPALYLLYRTICGEKTEEEEGARGSAVG